MFGTVRDKVEEAGIRLTKCNTLTTLTLSVKTTFMANGFYGYCETAPKLPVRVASEKRISTTKVSCSTVFTIDGHEFIDLQFRVLLHFKR